MLEYEREGEGQAEEKTEVFSVCTSEIVTHRARMEELLSLWRTKERVNVLALPSLDVICVEYELSPEENSAALFMADLSKDVEIRHLNEWGDCDVLKVGHHGSKTSSCGQFLEEVKPEAAIISVGKNNTYALPNDEVLKALREHGADIYRTDISGNITVRAEKNGKYKIMGYYN